MIRHADPERDASVVGFPVLPADANGALSSPVRRAGFAALIASHINMLRDFGILTVVDLTVSLLGVMLVLSATLVWAEQHGPFTLRDLNPRPLLHELWQALPRPRRPEPEPR